MYHVRLTLRIDSTGCACLQYVLAHTNGWIWHIAQVNVHLQSIPRIKIQNGPLRAWDHSLILQSDVQSG